MSTVAQRLRHSAVKHELPALRQQRGADFEENVRQKHHRSQHLHDAFLRSLWSDELLSNDSHCEGKQESHTCPTTTSVPRNIPVSRSGRNDSTMKY